MHISGRRRVGAVRTLQRLAPQPARRRSGRWLGRAALLVALVAAARLALQLRRDRLSRARLQSFWTVIPPLAGGPPLEIRTLVSTTPFTTLPPIVLVHGYGIGASYLVPLAAALAERANVYAPELPGHGPSDHDARPLDIPELATALMEWMEAQDLQGAVLVGHSLGCQVAAEVAARRPELVAGLVFIGPTSDAAARSVGQHVVRGLRGSAYERSSFAVWTALDYSRAGARVLRHEMRQMVQHHLEDVLPAIKVPVRVVRGGRDPIVSPAWAEEVARLVRAPAPTVIGRWGHAVHYDDPTAVAEVVFELAASVETHDAGFPTP